MKKTLLLSFLFCLVVLPTQNAKSDLSKKIYSVKLKAKNKFERSLITDTGAAIELVSEDFVIATAHQKALEKLSKYNLVISVEEIDSFRKSFPRRDRGFHDYQELTTELQKLAQLYPELVNLMSIGQSVEGRNIWALQVTGQMKQAESLPAAIYMGGHHAREHLSIEVPFRIIKFIIESYKTNPKIRALVDSRVIHYIPIVNPDGFEYDLSGFSYKYWRKNRARNEDQSYGVDLNRNYDFKWGTGGSSSDPEAETYMGPQAFSEPETKAIRDYIQKNQNITTLLSFHTYSQLILYPWGHTYESITNSRDKNVHEEMAKKMAEWNSYKPQQSSALYIASGDTTDWSYGTEGIISFTFELDPGPWGGGGFYPGDEIIPSVVQKNLEPFLYLLEYSDNPYRVLDKN